MRILSITSPDLSNGLGCRATIWVSGCTHKCPGCHNPHTWDYNIGADLSDIDNVIEILSSIKDQLDKPYIDGITLSGGDPLDQNDDSLRQLLSLVKAIKDDYPNKTIWIYSGDIFENLIKNELKLQILGYCDILVDGPFIQSQQKVGLPFRGSDNQRIIDLHSTLKHKSKIIEVEL